MEQSFSPVIFTGLRAVVLGAGRSGLAAARCLAQRGAHVRLSDAKTLSQSAKNTLETLEIPYEQGGHTAAALEAELVVVSPGIPWSAPVLAQARQRGLRVWSELELGFWLCLSRRLIAVTGTNGKSTTTRLIGALLAARGHAVALGGNLGTPLCQLLEAITPATWVVLEVSSFQLEAVEGFAPHIGVWLNLTPDHLDRHGTLARYRELKTRLFSRQTTADHAVLGAGLTLPQDFAPQRHAFSSVEHHGLHAHQRLNLGAALCAARLADPGCGLDGTDWHAAFQQPHCLEDLGAHGGVRYFNDSKATNPHAAQAALDALAPHGPLTVVLCGQPKGADPAPLARYIAAAPHVCQALLVGPHAPHWANALRRAGFLAFVAAETFDAALAARAPQARACALAPAGASFDQFSDYQARGEAFRAAVKKLR